MEKKWTKYILIINSVILLIILVIHLNNSIGSYFNYKPNHEIDRTTIFRLIEILTEIILCLGVFMSYREFRRKNKWETKKGLELGLNIQKKQEESLILFITTVTNNTTNIHEIENAILRFENINAPEEAYEIDLPFFTNDNINISNETLRCVYPVELSKYDENDKIWNVIFEMQPEKGLYRMAHSSFKGNLPTIFKKCDNT